MTQSTTQLRHTSHMQVSAQALEQTQEQLVSLNLEELIRRLETEAKPDHTITVSVKGSSGRETSQTFLKPGRLVILSDRDMPVKKELLTILEKNEILRAAVIVPQDIEQYVSKNTTDVVLVPGSLRNNYVRRLQARAKNIDPTITFISYDLGFETKNSWALGFENMPHWSLDDNRDTLIKGLLAASKKTNLQRLKNADMRIYKKLKAIEPLDPNLPITLTGEDAMNLALQFERYPTIEAALTDDSKDGVRRIRFGADLVDKMNGGPASWAIKRLGNDEYRDALSHRLHLYESHPDIYWSHPRWLLHAEYQKKHYVVFPLFQSVDLGDCISMLASLQTPSKYEAINAILLQNLATLSHLQRPLLFDHKPSEILLSTQKNPPTKSTNRFDGATATDLTTHSEPTHSLESKRVPSPQLLGDIIFSVETTVKNYLVGTRDAIKTLQRHSSLTMDAAAANEELEHIAAAFDYFNWLMPFPIDEHTRTFYELGFSILADNSPKNSGLEFSTKPQNAQQLWKYLTTSYRPNETLANRILGAYRVYESTSHPGLRLEDSIHMLGSEGVVLNAATYAHFRDHFITNLLANAKLATIADDWQGSFLASGAGIGVYKGLRKLHLISTQYMEQAKVRFTKREITQQEFTKKIGEYVERRKSWARNAIFFTDYLDALSEGTAQHLEGSSENVFAQFSGNNKNDFHMSQDAYTHAQKILKNVDTKLIQSSVRKYLDGTSHFIPFPDYMTRNAA